MWDSIDDKAATPLAVRVITGNFAIFVNFMAAKYFKLTVVAMVINSAPLVTLVLAGPILGEKTTLGEVLSLLLAFGGILLMILGGDNSEKRPAYTPGLIAYVALLLNPICIAAGNLAMRAMRKLNDNVVSSYMATSLFVVFFPLCLVNNENLGLILTFSFIDWVCLFGIAFGTILSQTFRFMALQNNTVSAL
jgi:drug/metabolite transporter (DMT)-like permease